MKKTLNFSDFWGNRIIKDSFSYEGARALFEYLEDYEMELGCSIEFDPIAIRCEYSQYTKEELYTDYKNIFEENEISVEDDINDIIDIFNHYTHTILVDDKSLIIENF